MKTFLKVVGAILISAVVMHYLLGIQDRDLYFSLKNEAIHSEKDPSGFIQETRLKLEARQKNDLKTYKWKDKGKGYVQIPVKRAFDYYLKSLPRN